MSHQYITQEEMKPAGFKRIRKSLQMTQKELSELIGVSKPTVERWEASDRPVPGPVAMLMHLLEDRPEVLEELSIPKQTYPMRMWYQFQDRICTLIDVDLVQRKVRIKNYVDNLQFRAFGVIEKPAYKDFEEFLESRCFPRERDQMKLMLQELGLPFYDPLMIVEKTQGRMAEDDFWIRIEK